MSEWTAIAARVRPALIAAGVDRARVDGATDEEVVEIARQIADAIQHVFSEWGLAMQPKIDAVVGVLRASIGGGELHECCEKWRSDNKKRLDHWHNRGCDTEPTIFAFCPECGSRLDAKP